MKKLYLMGGVPGSGKSSFLKIHDLGTSYSIISRDQIRFALVREDEEYFSHEDEVWKAYVSAAKESLAEVDATYLDATHISKASRRKILNALGSSLKDVEVNIIWFTIPLNIALERNEQRKGTRAYVPRGQIRRMFEQKQIPEIDEGFKRFYFVDSNSNISEVVRDE